MSSRTDRRHERWANLRHSIVGALLAAPSRRGELRAVIEALAENTYRHPVTASRCGLWFRRSSAGSTWRARPDTVTR
jgi:hypothetical protein